MQPWGLTGESAEARERERACLSVISVIGPKGHGGTSGECQETRRRLEVRSGAGRSDGTGLGQPGLGGVQSVMGSPSLGTVIAGSAQRLQHKENGAQE